MAVYTPGVPPIYPDAMIDLETLDTSRAPVILSIGWCLFDRGAEEFLEPVRHADPLRRRPLVGGVAVSVNDGLAQGLRLDEETLDWWTTHEERAAEWKRLRAQDRLTVRQALTVLDSVLRHHWSRVRIWSHGAAFDLAILEHVYRLVGMTVPWPYSACRDTRTYYDAVGDWPERRPVQHNAETDALEQAREVWHAAKRAMASGVG